MLISFFSWVWIVFSTFVMGMAAESLYSYVLLKNKENENIFRIDMIFAIGFLTVTVYAQIFSIFHAMDVLSNTLLAVICIFLAYILRKRIIRLSRNCLQQLRDFSVWRYSFVVIAVLYALMISTTNPTNYDDYLYHAQAIKWLEKYGMVKGLGNLHNRFAFNSAFLYLQSLFSWNYIPLVNDGLHTVNACAAALMYSFTILTVKKPSTCNDYETSDYLKLACIWYLTTNIRECSGSSTDYLCCIIVFYVFIRWIEMIEQKEKSIFPYAVLSIITLFCLILKTSAAPMVLFALFPLGCWIQQKKIVRLIIHMCIGIVIMLPYLISNVILSGWLVFPFPKLDLFSFKWKMPIESVEYEKAVTTVWNRRSHLLQKNGIDWISLSKLPVHRWFRTWFENEQGIYKFMFIITMIAVMLAIIYILLLKNNKKIIAPYSIPLFVAIVSFLFWFYNAPNVRFGGHVYMIAILCILFRALGEQYFQIFPIAILVVLFYDVFITNPIPYEKASLVIPKGYEYTETEYKEVDLNTPSGNHVAVYVPETGDRSDYQHFPETPYDSQLVGLGMLGETLGDGFYRMSDMR